MTYLASTLETRRLFIQISRHAPPLTTLAFNLIVTQLATNLLGKIWPYGGSVLEGLGGYGISSCDFGVS